MYCSCLMFLSGPESMEVEKWEEDEEVAMDIDMDDAMVIEMFDNVSSMFNGLREGVVDDSWFHLSCSYGTLEPPLDRRQT